MSDKTIAGLMGVIAGVLLCLVALLAATAGLGSPAGAGDAAQPGLASPGPPAGTVIEAAITEEYLNRAFMQNVPAGGNAAWTLEEGRVDIQAGNRVQFTAKVGSPLGTLIVKGTVGIAVQAEQLVLHVTEARLGTLPLTGLLKPFLPALEAQVNDEANRQLSERAAQAKVRLLGVASDETHLRFYLAGQ